MTMTTPSVGSFSDIPLHGDREVRPPTEAAVQEHVAAAASAQGYTPEQLQWHTPEGIDVKPVYIAADRSAAAADGYPLNSFPGEPPFVRGPYPTMYGRVPLQLLGRVPLRGRGRYDVFLHRGFGRWPHIAIAVQRDICEIANCGCRHRHSV